MSSHSFSALTATLLGARMNPASMGGVVFPGGGHAANRDLSYLLESIRDHIDSEEIDLVDSDAETVVLVTPEHSDEDEEPTIISETDDETETETESEAEAEPEPRVVDDEETETDEESDDEIENRPPSNVLAEIHHEGPRSLYTRVRGRIDSPRGRSAAHPYARRNDPDVRHELRLMRQELQCLRTRVNALEASAARPAPGSWMPR